MKRIIFFALICAFALGGGPAWSQDSQPAVRQMEPMEVSATPEQEAPASPFRLPQSALSGIWSIDQKSIQELKPTDVFDILSYAPGVQIAYQGRKGINFMSSRGGGNFIGGSNFAVLIDGAYITWTQAARILASFPVNSIESIQVVRDSTTLTLAPLTSPGSLGSSIGGVIIIKTRKPAQMENRIKVGYGNLNRYQAFASHANRFDAAYYSFSVNKRHDDGRDDWNNANDSTSILAQAGYDQHGFKADVSLYHDWASREFQRSLPVSKTADQKWEYDPLDTLMANLNLSKQWSPSQTTQLGVYTGQVDATVHYRSWSKPIYSWHDEEENVVQAQLRHVITTDKHNFRVGGQALFWETPEGQFFYEGFEREEQLYSLYAHEEYSFSPAFKVDAGARVDRRHISKGINKYAPTDPTPGVLIDDEWVEPNYSLAAGLSYRFNPIWEASFRASYSEQGADEFLVTKNDKDLAAEKQLRYEAGLIAKPHPALRATATAFYYDIRDMRQRVGSITVGEDVINIYDNADAARSGLELVLAGYIYTPKLRYDLSYSYQRSDNEIDDDAIPHHIASLRLGYKVGPFTSNLMLRYVSEYDSNQFAADNQYHQIGDFSRIDANLSYDFTTSAGQWRATLFAQNLTDDEYQTRLGWEDVGLTYGVELSVKF